MITITEEPYDGSAAVLLVPALLEDLNDRSLYESSGWHRITPYGLYKSSPEPVCLAKEIGSS